MNAPATSPEPFTEAALRPATRERLDRICMAAWDCRIDRRVTPEGFRRMVLRTLREVARDTRHACVERIAEIDGRHLISPEEALTCAQHRAMNARAI